MPREIVDWNYCFTACRTEVKAMELAQGSSVIHGKIIEKTTFCRDHEACLGLIYAINGTMS